MADYPYFLNIESPLKNSIQFINNYRNSTSLSDSPISSMNFDGNIPFSYFYVAASSVLPGQYFVWESSENPATTSVVVSAKLIHSVIPTSTSYVFYSLTADGSASQVANPINYDKYVWVFKEDWQSKIVGNTGWTITPEGNAIFSNVAVRGQIEANSGYIGGETGWTIQDSQITAGEGTFAVGVSASNYTFWAGDETASAAPFYVTNTGNLYAQNANITGSITATYGDIAGFIIDSNELKRSISKNRFSALDPGFETSWQTYYTLTKQTVIGPSSRITPSKITSSNKKYGLNGGGLYISTNPPTEGWVRMTSDIISNISPNTQYTLSLYIYDPDVIAYALTASYMSSSSTVLGTASVSLIGLTSSSTFDRHSLTFTTSASAASARYALETYVIETGGDGPFNIYFDAVQMEPAASATSWDIDSNIRVVSNASDNEDPYRVYITDNTSASTVLLALNPYGILQSRYFRVDYSGGATTNSLTSDDHPLQIGPFSASNLRFDAQGIQGIYNYTASNLFLNKLGGNIFIGPQAGTTKSNLSVWGDISASNAYVVINGTTVPLGGSATIAGSSSLTYAELTKTYVKNGYSASLAKGDIVYISGATGTNVLVSPASNNDEFTSSKTLGWLEQDLSINGFGYVVTNGYLGGLDTSAGAAGDPIWLSASVGKPIYGTANKPQTPSNLVFLGFVTKANPATGEVFVMVQNGFELEELHNVSAQSPNNYDVIAYDQSSSEWKAREYIPTFVQSSSPTTTADKYLWWDTSGDRLTLWIEDGV
jgi:hypothetical protein